MLSWVIFTKEINIWDINHQSRLMRLELKISLRIMDRPHCTKTLFWAKQAPNTVDRGQLVFNSRCHSTCCPSGDTWRPGGPLTTIPPFPIFHYLVSGPSKTNSISVLMVPAQASSIQIPSDVWTYILCKVEMTEWYPSSSMSRHSAPGMVLMTVRAFSLPTLMALHGSIRSPSGPVATEQQRHPMPRFTYLRGSSGNGCMLSHHRAFLSSHALYLSLHHHLPKKSDQRRSFSWG